MTVSAPERAATRRLASRRGGKRGGATPYVFVGPFVVLFMLFLVVPIVVAIVTSLFAVSQSGLGFTSTAQTSFVWFKNYLTALSDGQFVAGFGRVFLFGVVQVPVMLGIALMLALLFDSSVVRLKRFFQIAVFMPYAVPGVVAALLWGFLYQGGVSPIVQGLHAIGVPVNFLAPGTVLWSVANISTWSYVGVNMLIMFTSLQSVPREMYEAARIDGASEFRMAMQIKIPMIAPAILLTCLFSIIGTLQLFNEPQVLRSITSNVGGEFTPNMAVYSVTTQSGNVNLGSAMAIILGLVTFVLSIVVSRATNRRDSAA
ncbi:MAG: sugar ABC transporter permease [Rhodococcus sp. (in: high G+C Gram-positive bacteria)]